MFVEHSSLYDRIRDAGMTIFGLILAVVPLALWVAWSEPVYYAVLSICAVATTLFLALAWLGTPPERTSPFLAESKPPVIVSDEFIAELHSLFPLTYHHRSLGDPRLRRIFARLHALLRRGDN